MIQQTKQQIDNKIWAEEQMRKARPTMGTMKEGEQLMKYLIFDCEFATSKGGVEKICEFGYVVVDEKFNIIRQGNIIINPKIERNEWDWYAVKKILKRRIGEYENRLFFKAYYSQIAALFHDADYVIGHSIESDVHALNCELKRYKLPPLDFNYYDIREMYKNYSHSDKSVSVENMATQLGIDGDKQIHDAGADALNTMLELKAMLSNLELSFEEMVEACPTCKDSTKNLIIESIERAEKERAERKERMLAGEYSDGTNEMHKFKKGSNKAIFRMFLENVQVTTSGAGKLKGKKVCVSGNYERHHFKEMMNLVQIIKNERGDYCSKPEEADIFVTYLYEKGGELKPCVRENYADKAISEGREIQKIPFDEFLALLDLTNEKLESLPLPSIDCLFKDGAKIKNKKLLLK